MTEVGQLNPEKVKHRLHELLGEEIFAHLSVDTHTTVNKDDVQSMTVLDAGVEMTPGTKTALIGDANFSDFASRIDGVTHVECLASA